MKSGLFLPFAVASLAPTTFHEYELRTREVISFLKVYNPTALFFVELENRFFSSVLTCTNLTPDVDAYSIFKTLCSDSFYSSLSLERRLVDPPNLRRVRIASFLQRLPRHFLYLKSMPSDHGLTYRVYYVNRLPLTLVSMN